MPVTSAYEVIANGLKQIIDAEFAPEGIVASHDNLHESLGRDRRECGIAPIEDAVPMSAGLTLEAFVEVRFYDFWKQEITPTTAIDPRIIANYAERFRRAVKANSGNTPGLGILWFFDVKRVQYPNDPTGNKTRFHAQVKGQGNNSGLVETTG